MCKTKHVAEKYRSKEKLRTLVNNEDEHKGDETICMYTYIYILIYIYVYIFGDDDC